MEPLVILKFAVAATLLVIAPGPNTFLIFKTVSTSGRAPGFLNITGFLAAFCLHGTLAILGISVILVQAAEVFWVLKMLGAVYLGWIGFKALKDAWRGTTPLLDLPEQSTNHSKQSAFQSGFLTNALNPKVSLFYLAVFPQFMPLDANTTYYGIVLVIVHMLINAAWFSLLVMLLNSLRDVFQNRGFQRGINTITGAIFLWFSVRLATYKP